MNNQLFLRIALALLQARLKQSLVAAAGVTFGIGSFIALISFMTGLNEMLDNLVISRTPHIRLHTEIKPSPYQPVELSPRFKTHENFIHSIKPKDEGKEIRNSREILHVLESDKRVLGVTPRITAPVFFNTGEIEITGTINGVDVITEDQLFPLDDYIIQGKLTDLASVSNSVILGYGIASKMLIDIGDAVQVTTAQGDRAILKVVGIIQFGLTEVDDVVSYASLQTVQTLEGEPSGYVTELGIKLLDLQQAPAIAREYQQVFNVEATDIQTANAQFETGSSVRSIISYAVGITLLTVAGFGIYNILNMLIYEKMDAIAILKATGYGNSDIRKIFLYLSLIIGAAGGAVGLALGYALSVVISQIPFEAASLPTIKTYPVNFDAVYYVIGMVFAMAATYLAGLLPALKASDVDPVQIIRGK